jgi:nicotinamide-nucleotide amidase
MHNGKVIDSVKSDDPAELATSISQTLRRTRQTVAVAESLTSGAIAARLGAAEAAYEWFSGGVVAYASEVKFKVLDVDRGPVITASCARQMAAGVRSLIGSDLAVAVTGVGGPDPIEGHPSGTVFIAVCSDRLDRVSEHAFSGDPAEVVHATVVQALQTLLSLQTLLAPTQTSP